FLQALISFYLAPRTVCFFVSHRVFLLISILPPVGGQRGHFSPLVPCFQSEKPPRDLTCALYWGTTGAKSSPVLVLPRSDVYESVSQGRAFPGQIRSLSMLNSPFMPLAPRCQELTARIVLKSTITGVGKAC